MKSREKCMHYKQKETASNKLIEFTCMKKRKEYAINKSRHNETVIFNAKDCNDNEVSK